MQRKNELLIRAYMVMIFFVIFSAVIFYRVFNISYVEGEKWREKGGVYVKWIPIEADRGNIYSDDGSMLVTSLPFFDIRMDLLAAPKDVFNEGVDSLSILLSRHIDGTKSPREWRDELKTVRREGLQKKRPGCRYHYIASSVGYDDLNRLKRFPIFRKGKYGGGLIVEKKTERTKPYRSLAGRTLGEIRENAPDYGLESKFDKFLKGETDRKLMKRIPGGIWIPVYDPTEFESKRGDDLLTTINVDIQDITQQELLRAIYDNDAEGGTAMVMEVETGALKSIANFQRTKSGEYAEIYNHGIGTLSEPGSTFKTVSALAMLDDSLVTLDTEVDLRYGKKNFYGEWMYDSHPHNERVVDFAHAFAESSNVGVATLADEAYKGREGWKRFRDKFSEMQIDKVVGIELEGERKPYFKDPVADKKIWYATTVPWMSHGYELKITPLQTLSFYNAIANDGVLMKPYIVKEIQRKGKTHKSFDPVILNPSIASAGAVRDVQFLLEEAVNVGTGKGIKSEFIPFAGKTGTARVNYAVKHEAKKYNASFAGYFPADNPKYTIMVMVYEPKKKFYGGAVAGPVFKNVSEKIYALNHRQFESEAVEMVENKLPDSHSGYTRDFEKVFAHTGIRYSGNRASWSSIDPSVERMSIEKLKIKKDIVPDVAGMGLRDAMYILENLGLEVSAEGMGKVRRQSLRPGSRINGQEISIYLN